MVGKMGIVRLVGELILDGFCMIAELPKGRSVITRLPHLVYKSPWKRLGGAGYIDPAPAG